MSKMCKPYCTIKGARIAPCIIKRMAGWPKNWGSIPSRGMSGRPALRSKHVPLQRMLEVSYPYIKYLRHDAECSAVSKAEV